MKAAVLHSLGGPLRVEDVPIPEPGRDEVRVKIEASGLCHSDVHIKNGDWPVKPTLPLRLGHEGVGIVDRLGSNVTKVKEGDRVILPWLAWACGTCDPCLSGWETLCEQQVIRGYYVDGTHAEYTTAPAAYVEKVPGSISPAEVAPLACAGVATYKAVKVARVRAGDLVAIFGVGGLGHLAIQYARISGATVVAVTTRPEKVQMARELGAEYAINSEVTDAVRDIKQLGGADAAIVTTVSPKAFHQAHRSLRRGGVIEILALPAANIFELPIYETVLEGKKVEGSPVGTRLDLRETLELHVMGKTRMIYETRALDQVNETFDEVESGRAKARMVFTMGTAETDGRLRVGATVPRLTDLELARL